MTGRFIVLEGGEGVGKSTQSGLLGNVLSAHGRSAKATFEPGGTAEGLALRQKLLHGGDVSPEDELAWMLEDRRLHVEQLIRPQLAADVIVVCDRYTPSTLAYQGVARGMGVEEVERRSAEATGGLEPDLVLVLDLPDDVAELRVAGTRDRFERAGADFHAAVRQAYRDLAPDHGWHVIDATGDPDDVFHRYWEDLVQPLL
jgi:dTMP kinase